MTERMTDGEFELEFDWIRVEVSEGGDEAEAIALAKLKEEARRARASEARLMETLEDIKSRMLLSHTQRYEWDVVRSRVHAAACEALRAARGTHD